MSSELERRLAQLLREPRARDEVEQRALGLALEALPPSAARPNRRVRTALLATAATLVLLSLAAGALATAGALHVSIGASPHTRLPAQSSRLVPQLQLPADAEAVAAVVDGRLWLTARSGLRIQGLPVDSATLSPHALYVAAGIGDSLVAMAPNGARAWSRHVGGRVVAIGWAPDGLRIAYVVEHGAHCQLRTIEGNGLRDRLLDAAVRPVTPTWRADSLALGYVGAGGRPVVYDFGHVSHQLVKVRAVDGVVRLAFAPSGEALAIASGKRLWLAGPSGRPRAVDLGVGSVAGLAWVRGEVAVALNRKRRNGVSEALVRLFRLTPSGQPIGAGRLVMRGRIGALDASGREIIVANAPSSSATRLLASAADLPPSHTEQRSLLELPAGSTIDAVSIR